MGKTYWLASYLWKYEKHQKLFFLLLTQLTKPTNPISCIASFTK